MIVVCAWCGDRLKTVPGPEGSVSHGMCQACSYSFRDEKAVAFTRLMHRSNVRVCVETAERDRRTGKLGAAGVGVVLHCDGVRGDGCGRSQRCRTCRLREAIERTHADGMPRDGLVSEHPVREPGRVRTLHYFTAKLDDRVAVVFDVIGPEARAERTTPQCAKVLP